MGQSSKDIDNVHIVPQRALDCGPGLSGLIVDNFIYKDMHIYFLKEQSFNTRIFIYILKKC